MILRIRLIGLVILLSLAVGVPLSVEASINAYLRSTVGQPWGQSTNEDAMDQAFGIGNWDDLRYETVSAASLFSNSTRFIFLEGGDQNANELEAFLGSNTSTISNWVSSGGSLFVNAAPNEGNGMDFGFGVTLNYPQFTGANTASAVDPLHPIFAGPETPVVLNYTGGYFSHATVTDGISFSSIIENGNGDTVLGELDFGAGHVLFGGMTTDNFHSPQPAAHNLRINILEYGASLANQGQNTVPEPTMFLVWAGLACCCGFAVKQRR